MSRNRAPSKARKAKANEALALKARKRIWVKPERMLLGTDRNGNAIFGSRIDSTLKVYGRECSPKLIVKGLSKKPLGLVDDRLSDTSRELDAESKLRDKKRRKAIREIKAPDEVSLPLRAFFHKDNQPKVRVGTTPERTIYIEDEDGEMRKAKIKEQPKWAVVGKAGVVPNYQPPYSTTRQFGDTDEPPMNEDDETNT